MTPHAFIDKWRRATLKKLTLTNLYIARPQWIVDAHEALDVAVAGAYGWPPDIAATDALRELLAINLDDQRRKLLR